MRYERRRQRCSSCGGMFSRVYTHLHTTTATLGTPPPGGGCPATAHRATCTGIHTRDATEWLTFFPESTLSLLLCTASPPPIITPPTTTTKAASVGFLRPHCRWYLSVVTRTTPVTTEDRFSVWRWRRSAMLPSGAAPLRVIYSFVSLFFIRLPRNNRYRVHFPASCVTVNLVTSTITTIYAKNLLQDICFRFHSSGRDTISARAHEL